MQPERARGLKPRTRARDDALDEIEVRTDDGVALRGDVREPIGKERAGVAILAHAMMARRGEFERAGFAKFLPARGWRTIAFDFRGHGDSGTPAARGGTWTYDDLVTRDLPAVVAAVRARAKKLPVVVVGHSLGGHVVLAAQGTGRIAADAIVGLASNVWLRDFEPSRAAWLMKRATMALVRRTCERRGYFPARVLRMGSDDEASAYFAALVRATEENQWRSDDGVDYKAALANVTIPVLSLASDGDLLNCRPICAERFHSLCAGPRRFERIRRADDGGRAPGHMEIVTTDRAQSAWARTEAWMRDATR